MAKKLFFVAVLAATLVSFTAALGWASVPDPANSTVQWNNMICSDTKVLVCPGCGQLFSDGAGGWVMCPASWLYINVRDQFNAPMGGVAVNVTFDVDCDVHWCGPGLPDTTLFTDGSGDISLYVQAGLDRALDTQTDCCVATTTVSVLGVELHSETLEWLSPELEIGVEPGFVGGLDYTVFTTQDYSTLLNPKPLHCRTNYNCDAEVEGLDYSIWALHWLHGCIYNP
jgi:hypothetical protein